MEESVAQIRKLWDGKSTSFQGNNCKVENATIFTLPETLPPIFVAASGKKAAEIAGRQAEAIVADLVQRTEAPR